MIGFPPTGVYFAAAEINVPGWTFEQVEHRNRSAAVSRWGVFEPSNTAEGPVRALTTHAINDAFDVNHPLKKGEIAPI